MARLPLPINRYTANSRIVRRKGSRRPPGTRRRSRSVCRTRGRPVRCIRPSSCSVSRIRRSRRCSPPRCRPSSMHSTHCPRVMSQRFSSESVQSSWAVHSGVPPDPALVPPADAPAEPPVRAGDPVMRSLVTSPHATPPSGVKSAHAASVAAMLRIMGSPRRPRVEAGTRPRASPKRSHDPRSPLRARRNATPVAARSCRRGPPHEGEATRSS
jgi:hypothetical protein